jgi:hypothetical protein
MKQKAYNLRLHGIDLIEKSLIKSKGSKQIQPRNFIFNIGNNTEILAEKEVIISFLQIEIKEPEFNDKVGYISLGIGFQIDNFKEEIVQNTKGLYIIPDNLNILLRSISLSTARGVMFSEFKGTYLHYAFLPILPVDKFETQPLPNAEEEQVK